MTWLYTETCISDTSYCNETLNKNLFLMNRWGIWWVDDLFGFHLVLCFVFFFFLTSSFMLLNIWHKWWKFVLGNCCANVVSFFVSCFFLYSSFFLLLLLYQPKRQFLVIVLEFNLVLCCQICLHVEKHKTKSH